MQKQSRHLLMGIIAFVIGIAVIIFNLSLYEASFGKLWPSIILVIGMIFFIAYFLTKRSKERPAVLFIATFLALISVPLFIVSFTSRAALQYVWPGFLLAFGIGVLSLYYYGKRKKGSLILGSIVVVISLLVWIFYAARSELGLTTGVVLFLGGALFMTRGMLKEGGRPDLESVEDTGGELTE